MEESAVLEIIELAAQALPAISNIIATAQAAYAANDQVSLDAARAQALQLANAVRPAGADPLT